MLQRASSSFAVLAFACLLALPAAADDRPPSCTSADRIGCSFHPTYGWIAGSAPMQPTAGGAQPASSTLGAMTDAERQAAAKADADLAAQQAARRQSDANATLALTGLRSADAPPETPLDAYIRVKGACIESSWRVGCGKLAELLHQQPDLECQARWRNNRYEQCTPWPGDALNWADNGCSAGDRYACEVRARLQGAGSAPAVPMSSAPAMPVDGAPALPAGADPYLAYKAARKECLASSVGSGCGMAAQLVLDHPDLECRFMNEISGIYCRPSPNHAHWADIGCNRGDQYSCAVQKKVDEARDRARGR